MTTFYDKTGLPKSLAWGFIGVLIFMMGDGIEQTWLSRYIASQGLDHEVLFTVYGISVALSAWFSGVIAETIGVRRTMLLGYLVYLVGMAGFAGIGMMGLNYPVLLVTYAIKGLGYPLFADTFVVWVAYRVDKSRSKATGGTGLGLAIVKHIAAKHNAQIELESELGRGTKISVIFERCFKG